MGHRQEFGLEGCTESCHEFAKEFPDKEGVLVLGRCYMSLVACLFTPPHLPLAKSGN